MAKTVSLGERADLVVALFRRWSNARLSRVNPLPAMYDLGERHGAAPELVPACESCFSLTETCLGRPLCAGASGSEAFTRDELAMLLMLQQAPGSGPTRGSETIPHGLPGALCWASFAVVRALGDGVDAIDESVVSAFPGRTCPFGPLPARAA